MTNAKSPRTYVNNVSTSRVYFTALVGVSGFRVQPSVECTGPHTENFIKNKLNSLSVCTKMAEPGQLSMAIGLRAGRAKNLGFHSRKGLPDRFRVHRKRKIGLSLSYDYTENQLVQFVTGLEFVLRIVLPFSADNCFIFFILMQLV